MILFRDSSFDPLDLAYQYGASAEDLVSRNIALPRNSNISARVMSFLWRSLRRMSFRIEPLPNSVVLFYAESANQINSLMPIAKAMSKSGLPICFIAAAYRMDEYPSDVNLTLLAPSFQDTYKGLIQGLMALPSLLKRLASNRGSSAVLDQLLEPYRLAPMFQRVIDSTVPDLVIVANDHITSCRVLTHIARNKGVKTVYVQHAQVSNRFPPLAFDYALLDGEKSLEIYELIAKKHKVNTLPDVFLCGEKKTPVISNERGKAVGVGINTLDDVELVRKLILKLLVAGAQEVVIRLHPAMKGELESILRKACVDLQKVSIHLASSTPIVEFLERIRFLVAGDTSLHIDAQLNQVPSYYVCFDPDFLGSPYYDYYGFVEMGLVPHMPDDVMKLFPQHPVEQYIFNDVALRKFSATFQRDWFGREAELACLTLQAIRESDSTIIDALYFRRRSLGASSCFEVK